METDEKVHADYSAHSKYRELIRSNKLLSKTTKLYKTVLRLIVIHTIGTMHFYIRDEENSVFKIQYC